MIAVACWCKNLIFEDLASEGLLILMNTTNARFTAKKNEIFGNLFTGYIEFISVSKLYIL